MRKILLILLFCISLNSKLLADSCDLPDGCENEQFPYRFCDSSKIRTICTANPYNTGYKPLKLDYRMISYDSSSYYHVCQYAEKHTLVDSTYYITVDHDDIIGYDDDTGKPIYGYDDEGNEINKPYTSSEPLTVKVDSTYSEKVCCNDQFYGSCLAGGTTIVFDFTHTQNNFDTAMAAWTNICKDCTLNKTDLQFCAITFSWSTDPKKFENSDGTGADKIRGVVTLAMGANCKYDCSTGNVYLNQSDAFTGATKDAPCNYYKNFFLTETAGTKNDANGAYFSLTASFENLLGMLFGFDTNIGTKCAHSGSIMDETNFTNPNRTLSADDICMYKKMYCWTPSNDVKENQQEIISNVNIFPNPVQDNLTISNNIKYYNSNIEIYNIYGQKVLECPYANKIDVCKLTTGVYYLRINNDIIKFVKM